MYEHWLSNWNKTEAKLKLVNLIHFVHNLRTVEHSNQQPIVKKNLALIITKCCSGNKKLEIYFDHATLDLAFTFYIEVFRKVKFVINNNT